MLEGVLIGTGDLKFLSLSQPLNVLTTLACFALSKRLGMGVEVSDPNPSCPLSPVLNIALALTLEPRCRAADARPLSLSASPRSTLTLALTLTPLSTLSSALALTLSLTTDHMHDHTADVAHVHRLQHEPCGAELVPRVRVEEAVAALHGSATQARVSVTVCTTNKLVCTVHMHGPYVHRATTEHSLHLY